MKLVESLPKTLLKWLSLYLGWFKRVFLHDKESTLIHKENQLNQRFNQYYKFFEALKKYDLISVNEAIKSSHNIKQQQIEEHNKLVKRICPEKCSEKNEVKK
jgi:hypothetical protein